MNTNAGSSFGLIIGFFLITFGTFAQKDWEKKYNGFVLSPDSLVRGYLKLEVGTKERGNKISVYTKPRLSPLVFYTFELNAYAYKRDTFEIFYNLPSQFDGNTNFDIAEGRLSERGKLTLYDIINVKQAAVVMTAAGESGTVGRVILKHFVIQNNNGKLWLMNARNFVSVMHEVLPDSPQLIRAIDNKTLIYKDTRRIIREYNKLFQQ